MNNHWKTDKLVYPFGRGINLQIETKDIQIVQSVQKKHKIKSFKDVFESSYRVGRKTYKQLEILIQDPDGYLFRFSQDV